jgi:hypothetical protein
MAELFGCTPDNISLHLKNIYAENELDETATTEEFSVVQQEGARQVQRKKIFRTWMPSSPLVIASIQKGPPISGSGQPAYSKNR